MTSRGNAVWYLMRGSGVVSLLLLTGVMALGIATCGGVRSGRCRASPPSPCTAACRCWPWSSSRSTSPPRSSTPTPPCGSFDVFVPFAAAPRPLLVGLGALALDLVLALVGDRASCATRIGRRTWRAIHWAAYATWPAAFIHAIGIGTDTSSLWLRALAIGCVALIGGAVAWRLLLPSGTALVPRDGRADVHGAGHRPPARRSRRPACRGSSGPASRERGAGPHRAGPHRRGRAQRAARPRRRRLPHLPQDGGRRGAPRARGGGRQRHRGRAREPQGRRAPGPRSRPGHRRGAGGRGRGRRARGDRRHLARLAHRPGPRRRGAARRRGRGRAARCACRSPARPSASWPARRARSSTG